MRSHPTMVMDYCADLLSDSQNMEFMSALLSTPAGHWQRVADLAKKAGAPPPPERGPGKDLDVTWLEHPNLEEGFAVILFFSRSELWSNAAVYNRSWLLNRLLRR